MTVAEQGMPAVPCIGVLKSDAQHARPTCSKHNRRAVLFSTEVDLDAPTIYRDYKARFQIEIFQPHYDSSWALFFPAV